MGSEWSRVPFNEAVDINPKVPLAKRCKYPFVKMDDVTGALRSVDASTKRNFTGSGSRFLSGDTLMARITPCLENGKIAQYRPSEECLEPSFGSTEFIVIRGRSGITDADYVYYLAKWEKFRKFAIAQMTGSSGRQRVPVGSLGSFYLDIPPLPEQCAISNILGVLDDKIELNRQVNHTLEKMAQILFKSWFIDFDPVVYNAVQASNPVPEQFAETAARYREDSEAAPVPQDILERFPDRFEDSDLGPIPASWSIHTIGDFVAITKGRSYRSKDLEPSENALVTLKSFSRGGGYREGGLKPYTGDYKTEQVVEDGELVVAYTDVTQSADVVGRPAIVHGDPQFRRLIISVDVAVVRIDKEAPVTQEFIYCLMREVGYVDHAIGHATGTTVLHLSKEAVPSFKFVCPPPEVGRLFHEMTHDLFKRQRATIAENQCLGHIRDALLPKLISGELQIPDAENIAAANRESLVEE